MFQQDYPMRIFLTGSSSCLAKALLPKLFNLAFIDSIHGIDLRPTDMSHPKFSFAIDDVRTCEFDQAMRGCDVVIHLAFAIMRDGRSDEEMYQTNVVGTLRVLDAAHRSGAKRVINMSSVSVYGQGQNLSEDASLKPSESFTYAVHKAAIENEAKTKYPNTVHLRSHLIFGKNAQPFLHTMTNSRLFIALPEPAAQLQIIHEEDVADAIILALKNDKVGAFNLAAPEIVTLPELVRNGRKAMVPLPLRAVRKAASIAKHIGSREEFAWLDVMDTTLTVNCERARNELNWIPQFSAWDARSEMGLKSSK
jgi:UDP-glucose 4-epimerase